MPTRRWVLAGVAGLVCSDPLAASAAVDFAGMSQATHERGMRLAIAIAARNRRFPFGAVIVGADGGVLAEGVNNARANPVLHGEIVCMNAYVATRGNTGWADAILYSTAEPCAMCMSALVWAGIGGVVFGSPLATVDRWGHGKYGIAIGAREVVAASKGYAGGLLGGVLQAETDAMFAAGAPD